jgi:hypothetical protein
MAAAFCVTLVLDTQIQVDSADKDLRSGPDPPVLLWEKGALVRIGCGSFNH